MHAVDVIRAALACIRANLGEHPHAGNDHGLLDRISSDVELLSPLAQIAVPELAPVMAALPVVLDVLGAIGGEDTKD